MGEPCKESEAGGADTGQDQVTYRGQGDEEQWNVDRLAVFAESRRAPHEGEECHIQYFVSVFHVHSECLQLLEISWNLKFLLEMLEISWNFVDAPGKSS